MTGLVANPPNAYYCSTKFALEALTEALAKEVGPLGIKVTRDRAGRVPHRLGQALDARGGRRRSTPTPQTSARARS